MPEKNGYKTAQQLRETDGRTILAFLTGVAAPTVEVFRVTPFRYLMKQMGEEELKAELTACFQEVERRQRFIVFQAGGEILRLPAASVLYLVIQGRAVELVTDKGRRSLKAKMADMYSLLAPTGLGTATRATLSTSPGWCRQQQFGHYGKRRHPPDFPAEGQEL